MYLNFNLYWPWFVGKVGSGRQAILFLKFLSVSRLPVDLKMVIKKYSLSVSKLPYTLHHISRVETFMENFAIVRHKDILRMLELFAAPLN